MDKIELYKKLITKLIIHDANIDTCKLCKNYLPCPCELYQKGVGMTIEHNGKVTYHPNMKWDCLDFDLCDKREGTPCEDCCIKDFGINFELDDTKIEEILEEVE